jgi:uncharacterized SAM-binding protein YcdF (DUF218 family)
VSGAGTRAHRQPRQVAARNTVRRPPASVRRRARLSWKTRLGATAAALVAAVLAWAVLARETAPGGNTDRESFEAIVVLGQPTDADGNPTPEVLSEVTEAVREYERGVAPRIIFTGGAVANRFVEAQVMARTAEAQGVPRSAVLVEPQARDTIENACYSTRVMKANSWRSAEVISNAAHLPRAELVWSRTPGIEWRSHAAPGSSGESSLTGTAIEILKTARYLVWARQAERCEP